MRRFVPSFISALVLLACFIFSAPKASANTSFQMLNATGRTIYHVYFVPARNKDWGSDRLSGVWSSGNFLTLDTPKWRYWSLKIRFENGNETYWDGDNAIDTEEWREVIIKPNGNGGYTLTKQNK